MIFCSSRCRFSDERFCAACNVVPSASALATFNADPTNVAKRRAYLKAAIAAAVADAAYINGLDVQDVASIRSVLITELQTFLSVIAPALASTSPRRSSSLR
jgi:hypothetical protein